MLALLASHRYAQWRAGQGGPCNLILAWVAVFQYPRTCFTVRVAVVVVGGCGSGAKRVPHLESTHEWFQTKRWQKLWKNGWDVGAASTAPSCGIALWLVHVRGSGPPPPNPPFLFFLPCKTDLTNDLRGWQVGVGGWGMGGLNSSKSHHLRTWHLPRLAVYFGTCLRLCRRDVHWASSPPDNVIRPSVCAVFVLILAELSQIYQSWHAIALFYA